MPNVNDGGGATGHPPDEEKKCPFCNDKNHKGYTTKHGALKDESVLRRNIQTSDDVTDDIGTIYPLPGGSDNMKEWFAKPRVFEEDGTRIAAAPHHIIPGDAVMSKVPALEAWTTASKGGKVKEDIGYNIDGARNGIFLPRYPDIFGTKTIEVPKPGGGTQRMEGRKYYGRSWSELDGDEKKSVAYTIMCETGRQIHQTSHGAKYISDPNKSYNKEAADACSTLADFIKAKQLACPCDEQKAEPYDPPYDLVRLIDLESDKIRRRMTGRVKRWSTWCTRLAEECTLDIGSGRIREVSRFGISRVYN
ncbi:MAG: hypothetical protein ACE5F1_01925 [Planctomycetota bacterium]